MYCLLFKMFQNFEAVMQCFCQNWKPFVSFFLDPSFHWFNVLSKEFTEIIIMSTFSVKKFPNVRKNKISISCLKPCSIVSHTKYPHFTMFTMFCIQNVPISQCLPTVWFIPILPLVCNTQIKRQKRVFYFWYWNRFITIYLQWVH